MANVFTTAIENIQKRTMEVLREQAIVPRLINRDVADVAGSRGQVVTVNVPVAQTVRNVTPGQTGTNVNVTSTSATVTLNIWRESVINPTDKEMAELQAGFLPRQAEEALRALCNDVDQNLLTELYKSTYNASGTAGTTPFATNLGVFGTARKFLNQNAAPMENRAVVLDPAAEANALILGNFLQADQRGDQGGIINGQIGRKLGSDWYMDQNVRNHSSNGTISHTTSLLTKLAYATGATTITIDRATLTGTLVRGTLFTLAGDSQVYVVTATATAGSNAIALVIAPSLTATIASGQAFTLKAAHTANLHFHRDCMVMASRPLAASDVFRGGSEFMSVVDPISGLSVRMEISRQHRQTTLAWDILYGRTVVRPQLSARILG